MAALSSYFTPRQIENAHRLAAASIGKQVRVKLEKGFVQTGTIDACEPEYAGFKGRSVYVVFSVDVLCGENKSRKNFKLSQLPN